uniref:Glycosyltransferase family 1 protein n=1 Tax=Moniliophthora roreri TaxID=221103 RepID=A0A0W0EZ46_MONRR
MPALKHHVFAHAIAAWGKPFNPRHNKPLIAFAVLVTEARANAVVTIVTNETMYPKIMFEFNKLPEERRKLIQERINVLDIVGTTAHPVLCFPEVDIAFETLYKQTGTVKCLSSGKVIVAADLPKPTVAVIDPFANANIQAIRAIAPAEDVPIFSWLTCDAGGMLYVVGPEKLGGKHNPATLERVDEEVKAGKHPIQVCQEMLVTAKGDLLQLPGYPTMYDHEMYPQPSDAPNGFLWREAQITTYSTQGTINIASSVLEKETIETLKTYFQSIGKDYVNIAPMTIIPEPPTSRENNQVVLFLDKMQTRFGARSVIYISFGTFFWPDMACLSAILDELVDAQVPFLLTHPIVQLPEDLRDKILKSGIGMDVTWAPQQHVLAHPATGWFLTHGGWNSMQEAFFHKVPLICWPISAEQPLNAALLSIKFKAVFELIEVRRGEHGTKKPYRCGDGPAPKFTVDSVREEMRDLLTKLNADEGRVVRANFESLSDKLAMSWDDGGEAKEALNEFLNKYLL